MLPNSRYVTVSAILCVFVLGSRSRARAQTVDLAGLWPHENGRAWTYSSTYEDDSVGVESGHAALRLDGSGPGAGKVTVQYLWGEYNPGQQPSKLDAPAAGMPPGGGLMGALWRSRPDLRARLQARSAHKETAAYWPFLLLHPASPNEELGFRATAQRVGTWRDAITDWSWTFLTDDLAVGAQFTLQLVPDLADNVFLHAEVQSILPSMSLPAGVFDDILVMSYVVDHGQSILTNENAEVLGTFRVETRGTVAFAMGEGPIHMQEETQIAEFDCPSCTPEFLHGFWSRGELTSATRSVPAAVSTFGGLKAAYQR